MSGPKQMAVGNAWLVCRGCGQELDPKFGFHMDDCFPICCQCYGCVDALVDPESIEQIMSRAKL